MRNVFTVTEAKARLSELVNRLINRGDKIVLTKKGKEVAVIVTLQEYQELKRDREGGLISARGALAGLDDEVDGMCDAIYEARENERGRAVEL